MLGMGELFVEIDHRGGGQNRVLVDACRKEPTGPGATVKVDQSVFNPARIFKLYGTLACKGDDTRPSASHGSNLESAQ